MKIKRIKEYIKDHQISLWWRPEDQSSMCEAHRICIGDNGEILGICNCNSQNAVNGQSIILPSIESIRDFIETHEENEELPIWFNELDMED
jgi:hypothetical protein